MGPPLSRQPLSRRKKLVFGAIATLGVLSLLEGAVRVREKVLYGTFARAGTGLYRPPANAPAVVTITGAGVSSGTAVKLHRLQPGTDIQGARMQVHVSSLGLRGREVERPKPAGTTRVLCLGGSTTFDIYAVSDDVTWPALLEARLGKTHPRVEVVNGGVSGREAAEDLAPEVFELTRSLEPDVVVLYHATNDVTAACNRLAGRIKFATSADGGQGYPATRVVRAITDGSLLAYKVWLVTQSFTDPPETAGPASDLPDEDVAAFEATLRELVKRLQGIGARVALGTFALRWRADQPPEVQRRLARGASDRYPALSLEGINRTFRRYNDAIARVASDTGAILVPIADRLSGEERFFGDVMHTTREGSERLAEVVADGLEGAGALPGSR